MVHPSPGATRRARKRIARQNELLDAAMRLVVAHGLDGLTIAGLAEEVDAAVGALYRYFPSKGALVLALQRRAVDAYGAWMVQRLETAEAWLASEAASGPGAALFPVLCAVHAYLDHAVEEPALHRLIDVFVSAPEPLFTDEEAQDVALSLAPILGACERRVDAAVASGALGPGDAAQRTQLLLAAVHGLDHLRKRDRLQPPALRVPRLSVAMLESLLAGWGAEPEARSAALELWRRFRDGGTTH